MTIGGWIVLVCSVGTVATLFISSIWRVLTIPKETERIHGFEFETPDEIVEKAREKLNKKKSKK